MTKAKKDVKKKNSKKEVAQAISEQIRKVLQDNSKTLKTYKFKKKWGEKLEATKAIHKELEELTERAEKTRVSFWEMIEADVKFDRKKYEGRHVHLHLAENGDIELIEHNIPEEMCGVVKL